jgi:hypothetical protein
MSGSSLSNAVPTATPLAHLAVQRDATVEAFIDDLRKFVVYRSLAATLAGTGAMDSPASSLSTEVRDLREWRGWSDQGVTFLNTLRDDEALDQALSTYKVEVVEFCAWLGKWQAAVHRGALEELADLQRGFRNPKAAKVTLDPAIDEDSTVPSSWLHPQLTHQLVS